MPEAFNVQVVAIKSQPTVYGWKITQNNDVNAHLQI